MSGNGEKRHVRDTAETESGKLLNWKKRYAIKMDTGISDQGRKVVPLTDIEGSKVWSCC